MQFNVKTQKRIEFIDITTSVQSEINSQNISDGLCYVFIPHTTAAVTINENADPNVQLDMISTLNQLIPNRPEYLHMEGNSDSHVKASLIGSSETIAIDNGKLCLGTWQGIYFCEFDGPRTRKVIVKAFCSS